jgi:HAD superfamily hydrolase (TIGR01509 family)
MNLRDFDAVIFDLDGLILDTEPTYFIAWQKAAAQMGFDLPFEFFENLSGLSYVEIRAYFQTQCGENFDFDLFHVKSSQCWRGIVVHQGIAVKRGVLNLVDRLKAKKIPYCIATNSPRVNALECLALAKIDPVFPRVIAREDVVHGKPMPDIFLKAAEMLSVNIQSCIVLEDSPTGVLAANRAGAFTVFVPSAFPVDWQAQALANLTLAHLDEL